MDEKVAELRRARLIYAEYQRDLSSLEREIQEMINERYGHELTRRRSLCDTARKDIADLEHRALQAHWSTVGAA